MGLKLKLLNKTFKKHSLTDCYGYFSFWGHSGHLIFLFVEINIFFYLSITRKLFSKHNILFWVYKEKLLIFFISIVFGHVHSTPPPISFKKKN